MATRPGEENIILCTEYDKDVYLLYTQGFTQLYKAGKFVTILGEKHNNFHRDKSLEDLPSLDPFNYIETIRHSRVKTLVLAEIPPSGDPNIPSYNLETIRRNSNPINTDPTGKTKVLFADIRQKVFQVPHKTNFYLDIMTKTKDFPGNDALIDLKYGECHQFIIKVLDFFRFVVQQEVVKDNVAFKNYVGHFNVLTQNFAPLIGVSLREAIKESDWKWNQTVNVLPHIQTLKAIQMSVLDINMLYEMYRNSLYYDNFVFMVGEKHRLNLNDYFTHAGWDVLNNESDDGKNAVNLRKTKQPQTLQGCIEQLDLEPSELEQLKLAYSEQVEQAEYLAQTQSPSKKPKQ